MSIELIFWIAFVFVFFTIMSFDLFATGRRTHAMNVREAFFWSAVWIITSLLFGLAIYLFYPDGHTKAVEFITAFIIEKSLSVDNLFVFILIFSAMGIKPINQPRILKWGIFGAVILRILFILVGVGLMHAFSFMIYIFGAILVFTAIKMVLSGDEEIHPDKNPLIRGAKKIFNIDTTAATDHFFIKKGKIVYATMAFLTLILVESTDVVFAIDSIPAVLAISHDPFIAITSNLFAILGLRALYFALAGILELFRYLKYGIGFILLFIGVKMLVSGFYHISVNISLLVIAVSLTISILASVIIKPQKK